MVYVVMLEWLRVSLWSSHAHIETMMDNAPVSVSMPCVLTPHQAQHIPGDHLPNKLQQLSAATIFRGGGHTFMTDLLCDLVPVNNLVFISMLPVLVPA